MRYDGIKSVEVKKRVFKNVFDIETRLLNYLWLSGVFYLWENV
jgi:hypothetical protein